MSGKNDLVAFLVASLAAFLVAFLVASQAAFLDAFLAAPFAAEPYQTPEAAVPGMVDHTAAEAADIQHNLVLEEHIVSSCCCAVVRQA